MFFPAHMNKDGTVQTVRQHYYEYGIFEKTADTEGDKGAISGFSRAGGKKGRE